MKKAIAAFVALLLGTAAYLVGTMPARADVAAHWDGSGTWGNEVTAKFAGGKSESVTPFLFDLKVDGKVLKAYCIQLTVSTSSPVDYTEGDFSAVQDHASVLWAMLHGYPNVDTSTLGSAAGVSDLSTKDAITGTQSAIWHFSDGVTISGLSTKAQAVYDYLTGSKNTGTAAQPAPSLSLSPATATGVVGDRVGPFTLTTSGSGKAALTATGGATITDADGKVISQAKDGDEIYLTLATNGSSTLTASATTTVEAGRAFLAKGKQTLILAQSGTVNSSDSAMATWTKPPTTTITKIAAPTFTDGTCTVDNKVSTPDVTGIEWKVTGKADWGQTVTVTATAKPGYVIKDGVQTTWTHTFPAQPDCRVAVAPVAPTVSWQTCVAPGQPGAIVITPASTTGITYTVDGRTVTATPKTGYVLAAADGWTAGQNGTATYTVNDANPDDCVVEATAVNPTVTDSESCDVAGSYTIPETPGVVYLLDGEAIAAGSYDGPVAGTLTAVAADGYQLTNPDWSYDLVVHPAVGCASPSTPPTHSPTDSASTPPTDGGQTPTPGNPGTLPHTGGDAAGLAGTGLLVLLAGAGLIALTARRRPRGRHLS